MFGDPSDQPINGSRINGLLQCPGQHLEAVGQRLVNAERQLEEMAFKGLIPRVAALLLGAAEGDELKGLSHQDLAERLGVYRETVTNALNELKNANILSVGRKRITIIDRKRLERAAGE